ncbi:MULTISPECIES: ABC transporter substrate-binding protein [Caldanaerobacter]|jgi:multiple sugar transport system substrate-binding protein|uniref:Carbohydrate ABC transporter substrate-binding protein (CUT1 family) n=1 Tax=Caldanaerobacter subterraneus TaxID=911092 RepID=A0A4R2KDN8_9THEO|nr:MULTISPECIES: ABC transporter substrate-binding protein [Caldanaerobacter]MDI3517938.1 multiple sugar transport system substrate-binding protein [Caldanaerobacter sp.]TCO67998.1 carbohydrate ABC transporter substrate-binding protein (CUT1 family) [Caldanaerobacter subterraneus]
MGKKFLSILVLIFFVLATVLAGCSPSKTSESKTETQETVKPVTIKLGMWSSSPAEMKIVEDQIAKFKEKYPNINVQIETIVGDYMQQLQTQLAANTAPDIFYLDSMPAPQLMSSGVLEPLDEYIKKYNVDVNDFEPALLSAFQWEGKTYGLPKDYNTLALFYNKDMFKEAGINEPPKTWEELKDAAKKLTKDGVKGLVLSIDLARFNAFIHQNGGSVYKGGKPTLNLPENAQALDFYVGFITKDKVADTPQNMGEGWNGDAFAAKKAAMAIEGGWMIPFLKEKAPDLNYGIAELPAGKQKATMVFTVAYVMNKNSKHKDEAFKLIEFLTGKEGQQFVVEAGLALPSRKSMGAKFKEKYPERAALVDGASYAVPWQFGLDGPKIVDAANKACEALIMGQITNAQQALDNAQKEVGQ